MARRSLLRLTRYVSLAVLTVILLIGAGLAVTQTGWFKNWLRQKVVSQAAQYLNGTLTIERLGGSLLTGIELERVALHHEGQTVVAMDKLTVSYSPVTMISRGLIIESLVLDRPTILLQRDDLGWNFKRFVKTRENTGGRGAPPLTMESIDMTDGHLIVKDRGRLLEDVTDLDTRLRFAYLKPGIQINIARLSGHSPNVNLRKLAGDLGFDRGAIQVRDLAIETDRSKFVTTIALSSGATPQARTFDVDFDADQLSLPEVSRYFSALANINLEPAVNVKGHGTLDALAMDVRVVSSTGNARGPVVGHFGQTPGLEGTLYVENVNMQPILNRKEWATDVTGKADFNWVFKPLKVNFKFEGPEAQGLGYRAANVRAQGVYEPSLLRFDASGAAYGATATTRATFRFATAGRPLSYTLAGNFRNLDMRRLPDRLPVPKLESVAAGEYQFDVNGRDWRAVGRLSSSMVEGAHFDSSTVLELSSQDRILGYSASGYVARLDPQRFARPLEITWLDDERLRGSLTGSFTFEGNGRTVDELNLHATASLDDSTLAGVGFPQAQVDFQLVNRLMRSTFAGPFEHLPGSLFTARPELADTTLNGNANVAVALAIPETGPVALEAVSGSTTLAASTIAGIAVDEAQVIANFANRTLDIKELVVTGSEVQATAQGTLAMGDSGESNIQYDIAVATLEPLAKRFNQAASGAAHLVGEATGPASRLTISGSLAGNRLQYGTNVEALTANSTYTIELPDFDIERARIDADTNGTFVTIAGRNLPRVTAHTTYDSKTLEFTSRFEEETRSLGLGGNILFHPDHDEMHLRAFDLTVGKTQWTLPPGREGVVHYSSDFVRLEDIVLQRGTQLLTANGTVAVGSGSANLANDLNVRLDNVLVQDINELLLGQRPLAGVLNANAEIRGTRNDPRVQADFALTEGSVLAVKFNSLTGTVSYAGRAVDVDARLEQTPAAVLTAVGVVPVPNGPGATSRTEEFDLAVKSTPIDLGLLQAATTRVTKLTGQMQANVHVGGTIEAPRLNGLVEATNAGFTVPDTGVVYQNALARLNFEGDRLFVDRFQVSDADGDDLVAIGDLGIARRTLGTMNVQVSAHQFQILDNLFGQVEVDSDLRITGDASKPLVTGDVSSRAARLEVDQLLDRLTRTPYSTTATVATATDAAAADLKVGPTSGGGATSVGPGPTSGGGPASGGDPTSVGPGFSPAATTPRFYDAATVNIRVRLPDDLLLRGRDLQAGFSRIGLGDVNITVGGDLQVRKDPYSDPDVIGTVSVVRGFYDFQGRRFEVLRDSQIRFQGNRPIDPALQVAAQRVISGVTAIVNIRGTARRPALTLSSSPPMDEADVLSLVVFNQPINQLGEAERLNLVERAGTMAAGYLTPFLADSIGRALDLDLFEIRASGGVSGQPSVALGQQFGSRLFVSFRQEFGSADRRELAFEYRIHELLRLVSTVAQGTQQSHRTQRVEASGTDLIFVISY